MTDTKNINQTEGVEMTTREIIAKASTTGKAESSIGTITANTEGLRVTWKLNGKQISFDSLIDKLDD